MPPEVTKTEARQGRPVGAVRWILGISVILAIVAMILAYMFVLG